MKASDIRSLEVEGVNTEDHPLRKAIARPVKKLADKASSAAADVGDYLKNSTRYGTSINQGRGLAGVDKSDWELDDARESIGQKRQYGRGYYQGNTPIDTTAGIDIEEVNKKNKPNLSPPASAYRKGGY